ncbi:serine hydrolase [Robiginitalea sp. M366]|uniref:serine hydrolase domain-containing protein n=1 Tax=Robiginitalea aestuariiviva TaxID=3036903 RepID=UPI00240DC604|nr:serine hydrolase domain-containing protein [Robiginitalea aestuariiviva]MDG1572257.1 serine hydrolase [Robiginitalea aestuariiviva]
MKTALYSLILFALLGCARNIGQNSTQVSGQAGSRLDQYLNALTGLGQFNGVVLARSQGNLVLHKAYNMQEDAPATLRVVLGSQFDLRSVSKLLAGISMLRLESEGKIRLDAPLSAYLPDFPRGSEIRVSHLLEHRSGLPRDFATDSVLSLGPEQIYDLVRKEPLEFQPGKETRYSNVGYQLIYYLIGKVSGTSYRGYLQKEFFGPLKMKGAGSNFNPEQQLPPGYAYGHYRDAAEGLVSIPGFLPDEARMGNLHATASDMDIFLQALEKMEVQSFLEDGQLAHAGGTRGKRAYVFRDFNTGTSFVFLANYDGLPFERMVKDLRNILEGETVALPRAVHRKAIRLDPARLARYQGRYDFVDAGHLILDIRLERDTLWVYQKGKNNGPIIPESERVFFGDPTSEESLEFQEASDGAYTLWMDFQGVRWKGLPLDVSGE